MIARGVILAGLKASNATLGICISLYLLRHLGVSPALDALFVAQTLPLIMGRSLWAIIVPNLVTCLVEENARQRAANYYRRVLPHLLLPSAIASASLFLFAQPLIQLLAPGFSQETTAIAVQMLIALSPCLFLSCAGGTIGAALVFHDCFIPQDLSRVLWRLGALLAVTQTDIASSLLPYVRSLTILCALQVLFLLPFASRKRIQWWKPTWGSASRNGSLKPLAKALAMGLTTLLFTTLEDIINRWFLSGMPPGSIAIHSFSSRFAFVIPNLILAGYAIQFAAETAKAKLRTTRYWRVSMRLSWFTFQFGSLLSLFFFILLPSFLHLIRSQTRMSALEAELMLHCLQIMLLGLPALFAIRSIRAGFQIERSFRLIFILGATSVCLRAPLLLMFRDWGVASVAIAATVTVWLLLLGLWVVYARKLNGRFDPTSGRELFPVLFLGTFAISWFLRPAEQFTSTFVHTALQLLILALVGIGFLYLTLPSILKILREPDA